MNVGCCELSHIDGLLFSFAPSQILPSDASFIWAVTQHRVLIGAQDTQESRLSDYCIDWICDMRSTEKSLLALTMIR